MGSNRIANLEILLKIMLEVLLEIIELSIDFQIVIRKKY
jgi:hypothetical protein